MSQKLQTSEYKDHWQEEEVILERAGIDSVTSLGFKIAGGNDQPNAPNFTYIFVTGITENGLADRDKRLKSYDIILRVNDVDCSNIKHHLAVQTLKMSGKKVRLLIRHPKPEFTKVIELEHQNAKLGISIAGGIGSEYFQGDHGVFITNVFHPKHKQLNIGDRLLEISSATNTYDLRFVTHNEAKERIKLACSDSQKVKLTVCSYVDKLIRHTNELVIVRPKQYKPPSTQDEAAVRTNENNYSTIIAKDHQHVNFEPKRALSSLYESTTEPMFIESLDFEDYQKYEHRRKLQLVDCRTERSIASRLLSNTSFQTHLEVARKINILQYDHKNLREIPPEMCSLSNLRALSLNNNLIQLLPDDLQNLINLKNLYLTNNQIESLPSVVFTHHLSKLVNLQLNGNRIHVLPASFSHLTALKELHLSNNRFFTIPRAVLHLTNLQHLDLSFNRITKIKDAIELLEVDELNLNNNQINQISVNISKCKRLKILRLNNNNLNLKSIPTSLLRDSTVCQLSVKGNCFEDKQFVLVEGYDDYERRYTRNQRKKD